VNKLCDNGERIAQKLYILICGGTGSDTTGAMDIHAPAIILAGDSDPGTPNFEPDYSVFKTSVVFLTKTGTDNIYCARNDLALWAALMRWQFYCFDMREYCKDPWTCKSTG
jgi:hypothetical protein